jgi:hypothetical protein
MQEDDENPRERLEEDENAGESENLREREEDERTTIREDDKDENARE